MKIEVFSSAIETARELIRHLVTEMNAEPDKVFHLAVSGGETFALVFDLWANEYREVTPWKRLRFFWVDERCVPFDSMESHYGLICNFLFTVVPIPYENVFRIRGEEPVKEEVCRYAEVVRRQVPQEKGMPVFDWVLLTAGADGHTASIYPGQEELLTKACLYAPSREHGSGEQRITMTGGPLLHARQVVFLLTGTEVAGVVEEICCSGDADPASFIAHHARQTTLFVDKKAAALLKPEPDLK